MSAATELAKIEAEIVEHKVCPELAASAKQLVFGDGNPDAEVVFIGEAPGKHEDELGKPFVGAAGKFLDEMLAAAKLTRSDVYITNIVKYRPPNNRDPLPEEKQAFLPYLRAQLAAIQPKLVVTLGRHSLNCFLPELIISQCHGKPKRLRIRLAGETSAHLVLLPLYHPASALYNGAMRVILMDDFMKIPTILELINEQQSKQSTKGELYESKR